MRVGLLMEGPFEVAGEDTAAASMNGCRPRAPRLIEMLLGTVLRALQPLLLGEVGPGAGRYCTRKTKRASRSRRADRSRWCGVSLVPQTGVTCHAPLWLEGAWPPQVAEQYSLHVTGSVTAAPPEDLKGAWEEGGNKCFRMEQLPRARGGFACSWPTLGMRPVWC